MQKQLNEFQKDTGARFDRVDARLAGLERDISEMKSFQKVLFNYMEDRFDELSPVAKPIAK